MISMKDISIMEYDGVHSYQAGKPTLTTYYQNTKKLGEQAGKAMISMIEHPKTTMNEKIIVVGKLLTDETVRKID